MSVHRSDVILERMMALHPKIIDLTLDRVRRLLERLDNPHTKLAPVIHIAGTNGKGSTLAMIRAGIEASGLTCHAYTSPHLVRFHERIRIAGHLISEPDLTAILDECYAANGDAPITYFEITTCAALLAMSRVQADFTLLEVGLGGRLDATNVVEKPALSIITPVSMDHQQFLGNTLADIAAEKAGIIKRNTPCILGPQKDEGLDAIEKVAKRLGAPLLAYGQHWHASTERGRMIYQDETGLRDLPMPNLPGSHQLENAGAAVAALRRLELGDAALEAAVGGAEWPARMQRITSGGLADVAPTAELWLDGGHNPAAGRAIAQYLKSLPTKSTHLICGMLNTKDIAGYLRPLADVADSLTAVSIPGEANTLPASVTAKCASENGMKAMEAGSLQDALAAIVSLAPHARILICGSLYLAGHALRINGASTPA